MAHYLLTLVFFILVPINSLASPQQYSLFKIELIMAQKGDPDAQFNVGQAYETGTGVRRDLQKALHWYRKSAGQNHDFAQYSIGLFYEQGLGVAKDPTEAKKWYRLAAKNNNKLAKQKLLAKAKANIPSRKIPAKPRKKQKPRPVRPSAKRAPSARPKSKTTAKPASRTTRPQDIMNMVFRGKWNYKGKPVDYLPSAYANCLQRGASEIVCFTPELMRTLGDSLIAYTTKATIKGFSKEGNFTIDYIYNVTDINAASTPGPSTDVHGLQKRQGWQKTRLNLKCSARTPRRLICSRGKKRYTFTR